MRDETSTSTEPRAAAPAGVQADAAQADAAFGSDLYQVLAQDAADTVFSPASVASALRMALCGARGRPAEELAPALRLDGSRGADEVAAGALGLAPRAASAPPAATFRAPNPVWVQSGLPPRAEFTAALSRAAATFADADFAGNPEASRPKINAVTPAHTPARLTR